MNTATLSAAAPYIIQQDYAAYTDEQHAVWAELVGRVLPELEKHAAREYLEGFEIIGLQHDRLPNLASISARLEPSTGWNSTPVSGFLPAPAFFEMLAARRFPTTTWLRSRESLEYTPEPDIFHDVFGHVPDACAHGVCRFSGALRARLRRDSDAAVLEKLGRLFWYTVEFGVIRQQRRDQGLRQRPDQLARRVQERDRWALRHSRFLAGRSAEHSGESGRAAQTAVCREQFRPDLRGHARSGAAR